MAITFFAEGVKLPAIKKRETGDWIKNVFCSDEKILEINREYLDHDYYTDIITFDYTEKNRISGDIFISIDTVKSNADEFEVSYEEELHRIIIHGILPLCGINDKGPGEREIMTQKENEALALLSDKK